MHTASSIVLYGFPSIVHQSEYLCPPFKNGGAVRVPPLFKFKSSLRKPERVSPRRVQRAKDMQRIKLLECCGPEGCCHAPGLRSGRIAGDKCAVALGLCRVNFLCRVNQNNSIAGPRSLLI
jgi:hypothetical protein